MLIVRLWRMYPYVTKFILSVSNVTFSGEPKSISFEPFTKDIKKYMDKIHLDYFVPNDENMNKRKYISNDKPWKREYAQRDSLIDAIKKFDPKPNDLIFMSDID